MQLGILSSRQHYLNLECAQGSANNYSESPSAGHSLTITQEDHPWDLSSAKASSAIRSTIHIWCCSVTVLPRRNSQSWMPQLPTLFITHHTVCWNKVTDLEAEPTQALLKQSSVHESKDYPTHSGRKKKMIFCPSSTSPQIPTSPPEKENPTQTILSCTSVGKQLLNAI